MISYSNGRWIPSDEMAFPIVADSVGSIRGYRIFTACKTVGGGIFRVEDHIRRLWDSAAELRMNLPHSPNELRGLLSEAVKKNAVLGSELLIEIFYTGGPASANGTSPSGPAQLYILVLPLTPPTLETYRRGIALATFPYQRPFPSIKLTFYVGAVIAHHTVVPQYNADLPLFVCPTRGDILEGSIFNFFGVINNELVTPVCDGRILDGITRRHVIDLARTMNLGVRETVVSNIQDLHEAFITSSTRNIVAVVRVDDRVIGSGSPGPITQRLMAAMPGQIS